jgi:hypothetical protein
MQTVKHRTNKFMIAISRIILFFIFFSLNSLFRDKIIIPIINFTLVSYIFSRDSCKHPFLKKML